MKEERLNAKDLNEEEIKDVSYKVWEASFDWLIGDHDPKGYLGDGVYAIDFIGHQDYYEDGIYAILGFENFSKVEIAMIQERAKEMASKYPSGNRFRHDFL